MTENQLIENKIKIQFEKNKKLLASTDLLNFLNKVIALIESL